MTTVTCSIFNNFWKKKVAYSLWVFSQRIIIDVETNYGTFSVL